MEAVDQVLAALGEPTRRQTVELLIEAPRRTSELADELGVSVPAISRHLRVLRDRGIVDRIDVAGDGRGREYRIAPERLALLQSWLGGTHWRDQLRSQVADEQEILTRIAGFLDAFTRSDTAYFERHLGDDVELVFPGSDQRWDKPSTVASVSGHPPYVAWELADSSIRELGPALTLASVTVDVRRADAEQASRVVQSMIFDDRDDPWKLRFLQQSNTGDSP